MFKKIRWGVFVSLLALAITSSLAQDPDREAMFGLSWGMTVEEVQVLGVTLTKTRGDGNIEFYRASSLPKDLSDSDFYTLMFSDGKLAKLTAATKNITDDPAGRKGKERFETLKKSIEDKYGVMTNYQRTGAKLYQGADEFYECLRYSGCGMWVASVKTPGKYIAIEIVGLKRGVGYVRIISEAIPDWSEAVKKNKEGRAVRDKDAL